MNEYYCLRKWFVYRESFIQKLVLPVDPTAINYIVYNNGNAFTLSKFVLFGTHLRHYFRVFCAVRCSKIVKRSVSRSLYQWLTPPQQMQNMFAGHVF